MHNLKTQQLRLTIDVSEVEELTKEMSGRQIAEHYGVSPRTMARWLKEWGLTQSRRKLPPNEELAEMYESGMTTIQIAERLESTASLVSAHLRKHGVKMRPKNQHKGKPMSEAQKAKISAFRRNNFMGDKNPNWRGGKPRLWQKERTSYKSKEWSKAVRERDNHTCQICGETEGRLHAHHIKPWKHHPELRYEVDNGQTLCPPCHQDVHGFRFPWVQGERTKSAEQSQD